MRIEVHVDRLVMHGVAPADAPAVAAAFADRLGTLLAAGSAGSVGGAGNDDGVAGVGGAGWRDADRVRGGTFTPAATPAGTGRRIATAVHQGLSR